MRLKLNWIERWPPKPKVAGSIPVSRTTQNDKPGELLPNVHFICDNVAEGSCIDLSLQTMSQHFGSLELTVSSVA